MRIILACGVVLMHSASTSYGPGADRDLWMSPISPFVRIILPMFFALSGFLVAGSMLRCKTIIMFLGLRFIRIYPALAVEVLLSAFLIGAAVTTFDLSRYFTDPLFARYLVNVTGHISFLLPGVFADNPVPHIVNAQLWTVPFELICYLSITLCILAGAKKWHVIAPLAAALILLAHVGGRLYRGAVIAEPIDHVAGYLLVAYFLGGVSIYLYRDRIVCSPLWGAVSAIASIGLLSFSTGQYLALIPVSYLTAYLGTRNPARIAMLRGADYSYGVFLYGYAIQQTLMFAFPDLRIWWINAALALPIAFVFAWFSWTFVEKPALRLKSVVTRLENAWLSLHGKLPRPA